MVNDEAVIKQYLSKYKHADYATRDVITVIQRYRSLSCGFANFVFNNGSSKNLVNLEGTIPVPYKGVVYNIPVCIWLMDTHPQNAPLCFVKPTPDMSIKVSKYVDLNGKVYLPYLHSWNAKSSSLLNLITNMISAFSNIPPVYNKRNDAWAEQQNAAWNMPQMPGTAYDPQSYPPKPQGYPMPGMPLPGPPPYPAYGTPYPTNNLPYPSSNFSGAVPTTSGGTITDEHIKASLLSAVEDKLKRRLDEQTQQSSAELETLKRTHDELIEGQERLDNIIAKLQWERSELDKNVTVLQEKEKELEAAVERLAEQDGVDVDEAVITTAPLYSQLLTAFAEEATLEDAIYYMGEALRKEVIDLDTFLKQIRTLARQQFALRALMHKCRQKAQLAC